MKQQVILEENDYLFLRRAAFRWLMRDCNKDEFLEAKIEDLMATPRRTVTVSEE